MVEAAYKIAQIIGTSCKDGRHFQELVCVGADNHIIRVLLPVTNNCEYMPFGNLTNAQHVNIRTLVKLQRLVKLF